MPDDRRTPEMPTALNLAALANQAETDMQELVLAHEVPGKITRPDTLSAYWEGGTE